MSKLTDLQGRMKVVSGEMGALAVKEERTAEDESKLDALLAEFNELGPSIQREAAIQDAAAQAAKANEGRGAVATRQPVAGAEEAEKRAAEYKSLGQRFVESDALKEWQENGGKRSAPVKAGSFYHASAEMPHPNGDGPIDRRALVYSGAMPNSYIQPQYVPGFFRGDDLQGTLRSVLFNGQTSSDAITFFRELTATNNAAAVAEATATTGTTGLKPESGITFEEATAAVKTIATWIPITRQMIWDAPAMQSYIEGRLLDFVRLEESDQLLNGDGTGANLLGLLATSGVQNLTTAGEFTTTPVNDAATDNENFNRILRGKMKVRLVGRARANFVVINPSDLEGFLTSTDANKQYFGAGPFSGVGVPNLWGMTVVEDENIATGTALVGDGRMAGIWDRMQAQILIDTINDQFVRNMLTILAEERLALTVFRPSAFAKVQLA